MKLERISENQIRCTLNISDLKSREIKLSEFAYGSGKTHEFFRDMMRQASDELGFEVDDIPLMIEAIPVSSETITLIITKVDDPDDFEKLGKKINKLWDNDAPEDANDILEFDDLDYDDIEDAADSTDALPDELSDKNDCVYAAYSFDNLSSIIKLAKMLPSSFDLENALYKSSENSKYYLVVSGTSKQKDDYTRLIDIISEFATKEHATYATDNYFLEHYEHIIISDALQNLAHMFA